MSSMIYGCCAAHHRRDLDEAIAPLRRCLVPNSADGNAEFRGDGYVIGGVQSDARTRWHGDEERHIALVTSGHAYGSDRLSSGDDAAIVLDAYRDAGERLARHVHGPFAALIADAAEGRFLAVHDDLGCQPLFVAERDGVFFFSSSAESLLEGGLVEPQLDLDALAELFTVGFVIGERTLLKGVMRLRAGTTAVVDRDGLRLVHETSPFRHGIASADRKAWYRDVDALLDDCVRQQARYAEGERLLLELSGGLDSRLVLSYLLRRKVPFRARTQDNPAGGQTHEVRYAKLLAEEFEFPHELIPKVPGEETTFEYMLQRCRLTSTPMISGSCGETIKGMLHIRLPASDEKRRGTLERIFTPSFRRLLNADPYETMARTIDEIDHPCDIKRRQLFYIQHYSSHFRNENPGLHRLHRMFLRRNFIPFVDRALVEYLMDIPTPRFRNHKFYFKFYSNCHSNMLLYPSTTIDRRDPLIREKTFDRTSLYERQYLNYLEDYRTFSPLWQKEIFTGDLASKEEGVTACLVTQWHDVFFGHEASAARMRGVENRWLRDALARGEH